MKVYAVIFAFALFQHAYSQCLPATAYCLSPPAVEVLLPPTLPALPLTSCALPPALPELLPALAPLLASTISSSLAATLPALLEAALPTVLTSALASVAPLLGALPAAPQPLVYAASAPTCICL